MEAPATIGWQRKKVLHERASQFFWLQRQENCYVWNERVKIGHPQIVALRLRTLRSIARIEGCIDVERTMPRR